MPEKKGCDLLTVNQHQMLMRPAHLVEIHCKLQKMLAILEDFLFIHFFTESTLQLHYVLHHIWFNFILICYK